VLAGLELFLAVWLLAAVFGVLAFRQQRTAVDPHLVPVAREVVGEHALAIFDEAEALDLRAEGCWELVRGGSAPSKTRTYVAAFLSEDGLAELVLTVTRPRVEKRSLRELPVVWLFRSCHGERRCVTFGSSDGTPVRLLASVRDPDLLARPAVVGTLGELREAHERHVTDLGFDAQPVEAAAAPVRILETNRAALERAVAVGDYERVGDDVRPAWKTAARRSLAAVLVPIGHAPHPARAAIVLALIAAVGGAAAQAAPAQLATLNANQAELALAGLFFVLAAATTLLVRRSLFAWGFACVPAAIVLRDDRCPFAWIAALVAAVLVVDVRRRLR
jgi:hypothetical protein